MNVPLEFVIWYSGMEQQKVLNAYARWEKENGSVEDEFTDDDSDWSYDDSIDDDDERDEVEDAMDNCGQMADGLCMYAGSEQCEFECPFSKSMYANMNKKRDAGGRFCK
jgi:hypothetical protein